MKSKKIFALMLAVTMLITALVSCADNHEEQPSDSDQSTENNEIGDTTAVETEEEKVLTKFEIQFSEENEKLLAEILAADIDYNKADDQVPVISVKETSRVSAGDGAWTYVYKAATKELYDEYCDALLKTGLYAQYTETEFNGNSGRDNFFATFVSRRAQIDIGYHAMFARMYVTVTHRSRAVLPMREAPEYKAAGDKYPTIWTQFGLEDIDNSESSLGYIIRIADGSFIILDSGEPFEGVEERMYEILKMQAPDPDNIVISAWILTHGHNDHVGGFVRFAEQYGSDKTINVKQIVYNFPDNENVDNSIKTIHQNVKNAIMRFHSKPEILKPHTGNVLYYADVKINILYTQEDHLATEAFFGNYNTASIVTQFVMADGTKLLIGADHPVDGTLSGYTWCEGALWKWYGSFIESYVVSTFHHGYGGGADSMVYSIIKPKIVLWSVDQYRVDLNKLKDTSTNQYFTIIPTRRGVLNYYIAGDDIVILNFADGVATATEYDTFADYKAGKVKS